LNSRCRRSHAKGYADCFTAAARRHGPAGSLSHNAWVSIAITSCQIQREEQPMPDDGRTEEAYVENRHYTTSHQFVQFGTTQLERMGRESRERPTSIMQSKTKEPQRTAGSASKRGDTWSPRGKKFGKGDVSRVRTKSPFP
jgi:hypothetical protein